VEDPAVLLQLQVARAQAAAAVADAVQVAVQEQVRRQAGVARPMARATLRISQIRRFSDSRQRGSQSCWRVLNWIPESMVGCRHPILQFMMSFASLKDRRQKMVSVIAQRCST
jgi:hypothetical protein